MSEGIRLDAEVFSAFAAEFNLIEQQNISGSVSSLVLDDARQLQNFANFQTAFRYSKEIQKLEQKLHRYINSTGSE